jgi:ligand-binding sensor domain-containing protein
MLFCITPSSAGAQDRNAVSTSRPSGIVKLPVVDKQDIRFLPFSANGEAPRSRVLKFTQDGQGFLWLATTTGLYRYDGYSLKHYLHEPDDPASLSADRVRTVYKDRGGTVWIGTNEGLDRADATGNTFTHYRHDPADERSLSGNQVWVIYQDRDGTLWVGTGGGLDRMDPGASGFIHYRHDPRNEATLSNNGILSLHEDRRGNLWIGTGEGLNVLEKATGRISRFKHDPADPHSLGHGYVTAIAEDPAGMLWVGSCFGSGLSALDMKTGRLLLLSRGSAGRAGPHRSERALRGPRRSPLAGHGGQGLAEARPGA